MIIFLYGKDIYRLSENYKKVVESYKAKHGNGLSFFALDFSKETELYKLEDAVKSSSFFDEMKLVAVRDIFENEKASKKLTELIKSFELQNSKEVALAVVENMSQEEAAKSKELFKLLTSPGCLVRNFEFLTGVKLENWVKTEFAGRGCAIEKAALKELITATGNDSWALMNEINKLANFKIRGTVQSADIKLLVPEKTELNIFDFIDAVGSKNRSKAFELLFKEMKSGRDPYYTLTMIIYQFRNMLTIRDLMSRSLSQTEIAKKAGLHPFVVRKALQSSGKFALDELKKIYSNLLNLDISVKMGQTDLNDSLFNLVLLAP